MLVSFQVQDELDGVMGLVAGYMHFIHEVLDQEEAPSTRRLQPCQFGLDVRNQRLRHRLIPAAVGDPYRDSRIRGKDLDVDGEIRSVVVAVLHRIHRSLGNRGLEALETRYGKWPSQSRFADRPGDLVHGPMLVAG